MTHKRVPVLYLDVDGTVREGKDDPLGKFVNSAADVRVFPQAVVMMRRWKAAGGRIVGVSNQGGIALGIVPPLEVANAMAETHRQTGHLFDKLAWCAHHPSAENPEMARCWCRKPAPGLLIEASLELAAKHGEYYPPFMGLMVGDRREDEECAKRAGLDFQWARDWRAQA
jgi:D-glycero-D-manno-heptose 1,7-bisphosphate phosphatase